VKIFSIEVQTDLGRRVVQLAAPLDVAADADMPGAFRSLTEILWGLLCKMADQEIKTPVVKA
jgi:hypothetical protein